MYLLLAEPSKNAYQPEMTAGYPSCKTSVRTCVCLCVCVCVRVCVPTSLK